MLILCYGERCGLEIPHPVIVFLNRFFEFLHIVPVQPEAHVVRGRGGREQARPSAHPAEMIDHISVVCHQADHGVSTQAITRRRIPTRKIEERIVVGVCIMNDVAVYGSLFGLSIEVPLATLRVATVVFPGEADHGGPIFGPFHDPLEQGLRAWERVLQLRPEMAIQHILQPYLRDLVEDSLGLRVSSNLYVVNGTH
ncbi:hypothetical protein PG994_014408 [Apiospora phragmitis]|uniref:Uncharacterized protein n=1 Tax=Apiospora phragmitis TaxID=2905665 RepID=A0ABR1T488_9PEZI